jgi:hypothetical protein
VDTASTGDAAESMDIDSMDAAGTMDIKSTMDTIGTEALWTNQVNRYTMDTACTVGTAGTVDGEGTVDTADTAIQQVQ